MLIRFPKNSSNISSKLFISYLEINGWRKITFSKDTPYLIYKNIKENVAFQINVPMHEDYYDYNDMINEALRVLSNFENESYNSIIEKINNPGCDILKIRAKNNNIINGTIPVDEIINLINCTENIIRDAALDVTAKTKYRNGKNPKIVNDFISSCRFGQTEEGSFVISIICPFVENFNDNKPQIELFDYEEQNLTRKITSKLINSVNKLSAAISNNEEISSFIERDDDEFIGVNFMEDLSAFLQDQEDSLVEIKANFCGTKNNIEKSSSTIFESKNNLALSNFVKQFKDQIIKEEIIEFDGFVSLTKANPIISERNVGEVHVKSNVDGKIYKMILTSDDYNKALEAHKEGWLVFVSGINFNGEILNPTLNVRQKFNLFF